MELLARQLPLRMLGTLLGVPPEDGLWLVRCGDALIGNADPEVTDTPVGLADTDAYRLLPFRSPVSLELFANAADMLALLEHPHNWRNSCDDPALVPSAVEEMLRWGSVTMHFRRTAVVVDAPLGGTTIRAGDKVLISFLSATSTSGDSRAHSRSTSGARPTSISRLDSRVPTSAWA